MKKTQGVLIPNWRQSWRMLSVQALALTALLQVVWEQLPPDVVAMMDHDTAQTVTALLCVAGIVGRVIRQPSVDPKEGD